MSASKLIAAVNGHTAKEKALQNQFSAKPKKLSSDNKTERKFEAAFAMVHTDCKRFLLF